MQSDLEPTSPAYASGVEVSVLVPSYNSNPYIVDCIRSALAQGPSVEIMVQDGGSTDGSLEALAEFDDPRLHLISEPDTGQSAALNQALQRASGEFVMWLNADDLLADNAVAALLDAARAQDLSVVYGNYETIDVAGSVIKSYGSASLDRARLIRHGTYIFSGALLIRRRLLIEVGGFDADLHYCMDYDLLLRIAGKPGAGHISQVVAKFRRQPESKSESSWQPFLREWILVGRRHGATKFDSARTIIKFTTYNMLRPLWRSRAWLRVRPHKNLGGR